MRHPSCREIFIASPIDGKRFGFEITNAALGCFTPQSTFRRFVYNLVTNQYFDLFILVVVMWSTILLTMLNYDTMNDDGWIDFFFVNDFFFLVVFTLEFMLKVCAYGFIWCDNIE